MSADGWAGGQTDLVGCVGRPPESVSGGVCEGKPAEVFTPIAVGSQLPSGSRAVAGHLPWGPGVLASVWQEPPRGAQASLGSRGSAPRPVHLRGVGEPFSSVD